MPEPRVTILMPTYNVAPYIDEAIASVLRQHYADFRLLVMDDASTDGTPDHVRRHDDPRIQLVVNERNLGLADNLNRGLALCTTEYIARMDGDDIACPHWLEQEVGYLDRHPEVGVCGGGFERFGSSHSVVRFAQEHDDIAVGLLFACNVIVPTFRRSLVEQHRLRYSPEAFPAEDYHFWAQCLRATRLHNIPDTLFRYRMHATQICSSRREEQRVKVAEVRLYMLDWLCPDTTDADKDFFLHHFCDGPIASPPDLKAHRRFARRLLGLNARQGHFEPRALRRGLDWHIRMMLYNQNVERHFSRGYSPRRYLRYLAGGLALHSGWHLELKLLAKSLLFRH